MGANIEGLKPIIREVFNQAKTKLFSNQLITLTPDTVTKIKESGFGKPGVLVPRYDFTIPPKTGSIEILKLHWGWKYDYTNEVKKWTSGIYQGSMNFPPSCVCCMEKATRHEVIQLNVAKEIIGKAQIPGVTQKEADIIFDAWFYDRYWYAIPYCDNHGLKSKAVAFKVNAAKRFEFGFTNPEYGKLFGEINDIKGEWFTKKQRVINKIIGPVVGSLCGFSIFSGILLLIRGCRGKFDGVLKTPADIPIGISLIVGCIIIIFFLLKFVVEHGKGTDLNA